MFRTSRSIQLKLGSRSADVGLTPVDAATFELSCSEV